MASQLLLGRSNLGSQELISVSHNCCSVIGLRNVFACPSFIPTKENTVKLAVMNEKCTSYCQFLLLFFSRALHKPACLLWIINHLVMGTKLWVYVSVTVSHPGNPRFSRKTANTKWNLQLVHTNVCLFQAQRGDVEGNFIVFLLNSVNLKETFYVLM